MTADWPIVIACGVGAAGVSALLTYAFLGYARRAMLDQPGRRRSHTVATPRGGGVAIVLTIVAALVWLACSTQNTSEFAVIAAFGAALVLVAVVGWIDDHRPLPALLRLVVHFIASAYWVAQFSDAATSWLQFGLYVLLLVAAINFWNFMDGINGLIATQSAWVGAVAVLVFAAAGLWPWALIAAVLTGACLGFLPFNFPRARIFLGDVGSGGLGFACGALLLIAQTSGPLSLWTAAIVASAVLLDAGFTLASRMLRGRRWYTAHREHLYQWLVRSGLSHSQTTWLYLTWNLIPVLPLFWFAQTYPDRAPLAAIATALAGAVAWVLGKRALLARARHAGAR